VLPEGTTALHIGSLGHRQDEHRGPRHLFPGQDAGPAAAELLGKGPACVVVTDGAAAVRASTAGFRIRADVPPAPVVDTVGAGDAFGGAFLTWWIGNGLGRWLPPGLTQPG
jgi:sugar/nucleoside kinase (ribokinase family)